MENPRNQDPCCEAEIQQIMDRSSASGIAPLTVDGAEEDALLRRSRFLSREEVLRRRSRRIHQLERYYRAHYWGLMDELRVKYRDYYWEYGKSPFKGGVGAGEEEEDERGIQDGGNSVDGSDESGHRIGLGLGPGEKGRWCERDRHKRCAFTGCKTKAMALTRYCHLHILSDPNQRLYKACTYVVKSGQTGPVVCGKPTISAAVPSLCNIHFQKAQRHASQALKKAGFNGTASNKPAPKFHLIIAEYVHQIQSKRKLQKTAVANAMVKEEQAN